MKQRAQAVDALAALFAFVGFTNSMNINSVNYALAYCVKDEKILLLYRSNTGYADGYYCLAGGKIEPHESAQQAIIREMNEELGIIVKPQDTLLVHVMSYRGRAHGDHLNLVFAINEWEGTLNNNEPDKHGHFLWFSLSSLPENIIPLHKRMIDCIVQQQRYAQVGY